MLTHGTLLHHVPRTDVRLGRYQRLDARSLAHRHTHDPAAVFRPVRHEIPIPILNQGDLDVQGIDPSTFIPKAVMVKALGSCTANAGTAAVAFVLGLEGLAAAGLSATDPIVCEKFAITLYHDETRRDGIKGVWPPDDEGSSGLGCSRTLKSRGLIGSYVHATTADELISLLQVGPVMLGVPWFEDWFTPDADGYIDSGAWYDSKFAGGHEILVVGVETVAQDADGHVIPEETVLRIRNSWGLGWGLAGEFRMRLTTYVALRKYIDAIQIRPAKA